MTVVAAVAAVVVVVVVAAAAAAVVVVFQEVFGPMTLASAVMAYQLLYWNV